MEYIKHKLESLSLTTVVSVQNSTQFANDCALTEQMESALQLTVNKFAEVSHPFSLTIRFRKKKEVLFQYNPPTQTAINRSTLREQS